MTGIKFFTPSLVYGWNLEILILERSPLPYPVAEEGRSHLFNNLDRTLWDEKPTYTHISINIKHNFNQTNRTTLPIFRVIQQARSASLIVITGSHVEVISSRITCEERVLTLHTPIGGK